MRIPASLHSHVGAVNACFLHRHPASLSLALEAMADVLEEEKGDHGPAVRELRLAARAAYPSTDLDGARERYEVAISLLRGGSPDSGDHSQSG